MIMLNISYRKKASGLTLTELLVALTVSLILAAGMISILIQSRSSYKYNEALSAAHSDGATAITVLEQELRLAGYPQDALDLESGIAGTGGAAGATTFAVESTPSITWGGATGDNSIVIQYKAPAANHRNCAGETYALDAFVSERFSIGTDDTGRTGLLCEGLAEKVVLVENVSALSFTYGEDTDGDGVQNGYGAIGDGEISELRNVVSVNVGLTIDVDYTGSPDLQYSTTVPLRNQIQ